MTGADGIDIVSLPKLEIFLHQFFGDIVTGILVVLDVYKRQIVQSFTFCASSHPVTYLGATPVFVDSEEDTWNMDPIL